jgi:hypothetical protein
MSVEEQADTVRDLQSALHTAVSLQETIRHADTKAQALLGLQGGMAVMVLQQAPALAGAGCRPLLAVAGVVAVVWISGLAVSGWHLLAAMIPRLAGPHHANRFAFPAARPAEESLRAQRDEAWDTVAVLSAIAVAKHTRVRRALPTLVVATVAAGALLALTVVVAIAM